MVKILKDRSFRTMEHFIIPLNLSHQANLPNVYKLVNKLLELGIEVFWVAERLKMQDGFQCQPGDFIVPFQVFVDEIPVIENKVPSIIKDFAKQLQVKLIVINKNIKFKGFKLYKKKAALYCGETYRAVYIKYWKWMFRALERCGFRVSLITENEIREGILSEFQILIMPGGSSTGKAIALGPDGCKSIKEFIKKGGSYLGVCAGAYLPFGFNEPTRFMQMFSTSELINRPTGDSSLPRYLGEGWIFLYNVRPKHPVMFGYPKKFSIYLAGGPVLSSEGQLVSLGQFAEFGNMQWGIKSEDALKIAQGNTFIAVSDYEKGKTVLFSGHPENPEKEQNFGLLGNALFYLSLKSCETHEYKWPGPLWLKNRRIFENTDNNDSIYIKKNNYLINKILNMSMGFEKETHNLLKKINEMLEHLEKHKEYKVTDWYLNDLQVCLEEIGYCFKNIRYNLLQIDKNLDKKLIKRNYLCKYNNLTEKIRLLLYQLKNIYTNFEVIIKDFSFEHLEKLYQELLISYEKEEFNTYMNIKKEFNFYCHLMLSSQLGLNFMPKVMIIDRELNYLYEKMMQLK